MTLLRQWAADAYDPALAKLIFLFTNGLTIIMFKALKQCSSVQELTRAEISLSVRSVNRKRNVLGRLVSFGTNFFLIE